MDAPAQYQEMFTMQQQRQQPFQQQQQFLQQQPFLQQQLFQQQQSFLQQQLFQQQQQQQFSSTNIEQPLATPSMAQLTQVSAHQILCFLSLNLKSVHCAGWIR